MAVADALAMASGGEMLPDYDVGATPDAGFHAAFALLEAGDVASATAALAQARAAYLHSTCAAA